MVVGKRASEGDAPAILEPLQEVEVLEHTAARLECRVTGASLEVTWYKDDKPIREGPQISTHFADNVCSLVIPRTELDDEALYR